MVCILKYLTVVIQVQKGWVFPKLTRWNCCSSFQPDDEYDLDTRIVLVVEELSLFLPPFNPGWLYCVFALLPACNVCTAGWNPAPWKVPSFLGIFNLFPASFILSRLFCCTHIQTPNTTTCYSSTAVQYWHSNILKHSSATAASVFFNCWRD